MLPTLKPVQQNYSYTNNFVNNKFGYLKILFGKQSNRKRIANQ